MLRDYQQEAVDTSIGQLKKSALPTLIEAATGSGKSHIITAIAQWYIEHTGKKVLCLAPSKELTEQNCEKFVNLGMDASIFCASIEKCLRHSVVFGTPLSVKNSLEQFTGFGLVIVDECHQTDNTKQIIIQHLQDKNPNLRVFGLTATPFRMGDGYIYALDESGKKKKDYVENYEEREKGDPFYNQLAYKITAPYLIEQGYLTGFKTPDTIKGYKTSHLKIGSHGKFVVAEVEAAVTGKGRLTAEIVNNFVHLSEDKNSVLIFATSRKHNLEILASLPAHQASYIDGETPKLERERIIQQFKSLEIKYLVNVGVLTTGFDAPNVDVVVIMRPSESAGLIQQMAGRGMRLSDFKNDCLLLDYAENIERLFHNKDIFSPKISTDKLDGESEPIDIMCPECGFQNQFKPRIIMVDDGNGNFVENENKIKHSSSTLDPHGYIIGDDGLQIISKKTGSPVCGHYGRRCERIIEIVNDGFVSNSRCSYIFSYRACASCGHHNDITRRDCTECNEELINPNDKLKADFSKVDDCTKVRTELVVNVSMVKHIGKNETSMLKAQYNTSERCVTFWYNCTHKYAKASWDDLCAAVFGKIVTEGMIVINSVDQFIELLPKGVPPKTITYKNEKKDGSDFWRVSGHNKPLN